MCPAGRSPVVEAASIRVAHRHMLLFRFLPAAGRSLRRSGESSQQQYVFSISTDQGLFIMYVINTFRQEGDKKQHTLRRLQPGMKARSGSTSANKCSGNMLWACHICCLRLPACASMHMLCVNDPRTSAFASPKLVMEMQYLSPSFFFSSVSMPIRVAIWDCHI